MERHPIPFVDGPLMHFVNYQFLLSLEPKTLSHIESILIVNLNSNRMSQMYQKWVLWDGPKNRFQFQHFRPIRARPVACIGILVRAMHFAPNQTAAAAVDDVQCSRIPSIPRQPRNAGSARRVARFCSARKSNTD